MQDAVKAAQMLLKDIRSVFAQKAAAEKEAREAQPKKVPAHKAKAKAKAGAA